MYGPIGAGKTIVLKRLSWPAMAKKPDFLSEENRFVAFYIDLEGISYLNALFDEKIFGSYWKSRQYSLQVAFYASVLYLLIEISNNLSAVQSLDITEKGPINRAFFSTCRNLLTPIFGNDLKTPTDVRNFVELKSREIMAAISGSSGLENNIIEYAKLFPSPEQFALLFSSACFSDPDFNKNTRIGFLLDQYEAIHEKLQSIFNPLLKRENQRYFFAVAASRPFGMSLEVPDGNLQPEEDFHIRVMEYLPDDIARYRDLIIEICRQILPAGISIEDLLNFGKEEPQADKRGATFTGFDSICELSSRSVRLFFKLCRDAVDLTPGDWMSGIPKGPQIEAIDQMSKNERDRIKGIPGITQGVAWKLLLLILRKANQNLDGDRRLPKVINIKSSGVLGIEDISQYAKALLKAGFRENCIQFLKKKDVSSESLPEQFTLSPITAPVLNAFIDEHLSISVTTDEIHSVASPPRRPTRKIKEELIPPLEELRSVFLAISFADLPEPKATRALYGEIFKEKDISVVEGSAIGPGMISQLFSRINSTDLTILELSYLRANVIVEMGLTLGIEHRIMPVYHSEVETDLSLWPFLSDMGSFPYSLDKNGIRAVRDKVIKWSKEPINSAHLLKKSLDGSTNLWVSRDSSSFFFYYPETRSKFWSNYKDDIIELAKKRNYETLFPDDNPLGLLYIENVVRLIMKSSRIIIDTSREGNIDLYGAFALGFAFALSCVGSKRRIIRLEEKGKVFPQEMRMWPSDPDYYRVWSENEELLSFVTEFLRDERKKRKQ